MQKIKILHVVHDFLFGGIESYLYYLTQAQLQNPELEVAILCCQDEIKVSNPRIKLLNINIYYVPIRAFDMGIKKYRKISQIASKYNVVQLHIFKPLLLESLFKSGAEVIFTIHTAGAVRREQTLYNKAKSWFQVWHLNKRTHGIVCNSVFSQQYWQKKGLKSGHNQVIYNGVQFNPQVDNDFVLSQYPSLENKFIVGTTSRFIGWKRVDYLIRAFALLYSKNNQTRLLLVGDGREMEPLKDLVEELNVKDAVLFTGYQKNVTAFQAAMDVCVFPSVSEPFGLVAIECLHLGKPVVVMRDGGGLTELLEQIEPNNIVDDIAQLAGNLYNLSKKTLEEDHNSAKERVAFSEDFNVLTIEKKYFKYYKNLLADA